MSKKSDKIRNVRNFVKSYLSGKNGQRCLREGKPLAHAFARAVAE